MIFFKKNNTRFFLFMSWLKERHVEVGIEVTLNDDQLAELMKNMKPLSEALKSTHEECQRLFAAFWGTDLLDKRESAFNQVGVKSKRPLVDSKLSDMFWNKLRLYIRESMTKKDLQSLQEIRHIMKTDPILANAYRF